MIIHRKWILVKNADLERFTNSITEWVSWLDSARFTEEAIKSLIEEETPGGSLVPVNQETGLTVKVNTIGVHYCALAFCPQRMVAP